MFYSIFSFVLSLFQGLLYVSRCFYVLVAIRALRISVDYDDDDDDDDNP